MCICIYVYIDSVHREVVIGKICLNLQRMSEDSLLSTCMWSHVYSEYQAGPLHKNMTLRDAERAGTPRLASRRRGACPGRRRQQGKEKKYFKFKIKNCYCCFFIFFAALPPPFLYL